MTRSILCTGLVLASVAGAQAAETQPVESFIIQALPLAEREAEALQPATILGEEALLRRGGASLGDTLAGETGISSSDFGVGVGRPVIRGLGGARVRVQENGLSAADVSTLSADHAVSVDPLSALQVEVLKGPATLLYGSGAIGGVVNVVTDRVPQTAPGDLAGHAGFALGDNTLDERLAHLAVNGGAGDIGWNLQGLTRRTGDYRADGRRIANSDTDTDSLSAGASRIGSDGYLGAAVSGYRHDYGIPGEDAVIAIEQDRLDLRGELADPLPGFQRLRLAAAHTDYQHDESGHVFFDNQETELRLELRHGAAAGWNGALGLQATDRRFRAFGEEEVFVPATDTRTVGLFAVEERPVDAWKLQLGARVEHRTHDPEDTNPDRDHTPVSLAVGVLRPIGADHVVTVNAGRYQRAPATEELYSFGPHEASQTFEHGDEDFAEETAYALDLGLRRTQGRLRWSANLFYTDYADFIYLESVDRGLDADGGGTPSADGIPDRVDEEGVFAPDGELLLLDYKAGDAHFYGGEVEVAYDLLAGTPRLTARLFGDLVRAGLDNGPDLPRIPPARIGAGLEYRTPAWLTSLEVLHAATQTRTGPLEDRTPGFTDLSAFAAYRLPGESERRLYLRAENLLDDRIVRHASFLDVPQPGRRITVGIEARF